MTMACTNDERFWDGNWRNRVRGLRRRGIRGQLLETQPEARGDQANAQGDQRHHHSSTEQRRQMPPEDLPKEPRKILHLPLAREGLPEDALGGDAKLRQPACSAGGHQTGKHQKLQGRYEFARGRELAILARLLQPPGRRLFGFAAAVRHTAS